MTNSTHANKFLENTLFTPISRKIFKLVLTSAIEYGYRRIIAYLKPSREGYKISLTAQLTVYMYEDYF